MPPEKCLKNLKPLKAGEQRTKDIVAKSNRSPVRAANRSIRAVVARYLAEADKDGKPNADVIFGEVLMRLAKKGNLKAMELIARVSGELSQEAAPAIEEAAPAAITKIAKLWAWLEWQRTSGANVAFLYGTTRSGKTYAVCQWLCELISTGALSGNVLICGQTIPFLRNGCAAYLATIAPQYGLAVKDGGLRIEGTGGAIVLQSFEKPERVLSAQWSLVFVNEGNVIPQPIVDGLRIRCAGLLLADFNPSVNEWWGQSLMEAGNSLFCSFRDNPYLGDTQLAAIESIRERGENAPAGSYPYWYYQVYYLGKFAEAGGGVFTQVCRGKDWEAIDAPTFWGVDWGDTSDPNALVAIKVTEGGSCIHVKCQLYQTGLSDKEVAQRLEAAGVTTLVFETATGGNTRAKNLRAFGFGGRLVPCVKERVSQGVFNICEKKIVCYDDFSFSEFHNYRLDKGEFSGADHCIDATRYVAALALTNKLR